MNIHLYGRLLQHYFSFRNVCLETVTQFLNHKDECDFNSNTTEDILQNGRCKMIV